MKLFRYTKADARITLHLFKRLGISIYCLFTGKPVTNFIKMDQPQQDHYKAKPRLNAFFDTFVTTIAIPIAIAAMPLCLISDIVTHAIQAISAICTGFAGLFKSKNTDNDSNTSDDGLDDYGLEQEPKTKQNISQEDLNQNVIVIIPDNHPFIPLNNNQQAHTILFSDYLNYQNRSIMNPTLDLNDTQAYTMQFSDYLNYHDRRIMNSTLEEPCKVSNSNLKHN